MSAPQLRKWSFCAVWITLLSLHLLGVGFYGIYVINRDYRFDEFASLGLIFAYGVLLMFLPAIYGLNLARKLPRNKMITDALRIYAVILTLIWLFVGVSAPGIMRGRTRGEHRVHEIIKIEVINPDATRK